jgi:endonuclease/exonuclease/phosphatase family metal-dependent hydrolase
VIVATWNVENLFLPGNEAGPPDEASYQAKLATLAREIAALEPDVLALQEIGDPQALEDRADAVGGQWHLALSEFPDERGIRVAFMSRPAIDEAVHIRRFPAGLDAVQVGDDGETSAEMGRGALQVRVTVAQRPVELVTAHLKSKLLTYPGDRFTPREESERARFGAYAVYRRAGEAVTLRVAANELLDGQGGERTLIVLGDLNDEPQAATTQILLGPPGSEIGTAGFDRPDAGDPWRLWNLAPLIPAERRYTRVYRGRRELIDHILVSRALVTRAIRVDTAAHPPPPISDDRAERRTDPSSDHAVVVAEFDLD